MSLRHLVFTSSIVLALAAGCSNPEGGDNPDTGGSGIDTGTGRVDTGVPGTDTGVPGTDTGVPGTDTGVPGTDAGLDAASGDDTGTSGTCTPACGAGFTCNAAGYCESATGIPAFDHVYVVIFENRSLASVMGHAPYLDGLAASGAYATHYDSVTHPSLPNYIAMTSGDIWGNSCDCAPGTGNDCTGFTCSLISHSCTCEHDVAHIGDQLDTLSIPWRSYGEGMGAPCRSTDLGSAHYAVKHLPFLYYTNVLSSTTRCQAHVRDLADLTADLGSYRFTMITPNLCNDMHDTCGGNAVTHGDTWASTAIPPILAQPGFAAGGRDVLFLVWDEQDNSLGSAPIPFIVVSPLITAGTTTTAMYDHYALLATWEDGFGAPRLGHAAAATPIADIWR